MSSCGRPVTLRICNKLYLCLEEGELPRPDILPVSETSTDRTRPQRKVEPKMIYITFQFEDGGRGHRSWSERPLHNFIVALLLSLRIETRQSYQEQRVLPGIVIKWEDQWSHAPLSSLRWFNHQSDFSLLLFCFYLSLPQHYYQPGAENIAYSSLHPLWAYLGAIHLMPNEMNW